MAKAIRKNLEDIALAAVPQATPGLNIPIDFWRGKKGAEEIFEAMTENFTQVDFKYRTANPGGLETLAGQMSESIPRHIVFKLQKRFKKKS